MTHLKSRQMNGRERDAVYRENHDNIYFLKELNMSVSSVEDI